LCFFCVNSFVKPSAAMPLNVERRWPCLITHLYRMTMIIRVLQVECRKVGVQAVGNKDVGLWLRCAAFFQDAGNPLRRLDRSVGVRLTNSESLVLRATKV
jgi:hypothetical protein